MLPAVCAGHRHYPQRVDWLSGWESAAIITEVFLLGALAIAVAMKLFNRGSL